MDLGHNRFPCWASVMSLLFKSGLLVLSVHASLAICSLGNNHTQALNWSDDTLFLPIVSLTATVPAVLYPQWLMVWILSMPHLIQHGVVTLQGTVPVIPICKFTNHIWLQLVGRTVKQGFEYQQKLNWMELYRCHNHAVNSDFERNEVVHIIQQGDYHWPTTCECCAPEQLSWWVC